MANESQIAVHGADAVKAFTLGHPIVLAVAGGAILGTGIYYGIQRYRKNKADKAADTTTATVEPAAA